MINKEEEKHCFLNLLNKLYKNKKPTYIGSTPLSTLNLFFDTTNENNFLWIVAKINPINNELGLHKKIGLNYYDENNTKLILEDDLHNVFDQIYENHKFNYEDIKYTIEQKIINLS